MHLQSPYVQIWSPSSCSRWTTDRSEMFLNPSLSLHKQLHRQTEGLLWAPASGAPGSLKPGSRWTQRAASGQELRIQSPCARLAPTFSTPPHSCYECELLSTDSTKCPISGLSGQMRLFPTRNNIQMPNTSGQSPCLRKGQTPGAIHTPELLVGPADTKPLPSPPACLTPP